MTNIIAFSIVWFVYEFFLSAQLQVVPVLELAEQKIRELQLLPNNLNIKWIQYDDKCDASYATISAMDGYGMNCAHVLFGPACDYALGKFMLVLIVVVVFAKREFISARLIYYSTIKFCIIIWESFQLFLPWISTEAQAKGCAIQQLVGFVIKITFHTHS